MSENSVQTKKSGKFVRFLKETKAEMKKVTWPSRKTLVHNTLVILAFIIITCIILSLCDVVFSSLLEVFTNTLK